MSADIQPLPAYEFKIKGKSSEESANDVETASAIPESGSPEAPGILTTIVSFFAAKPEPSVPAAPATPSLLQRIFCGNSKLPICSEVTAENEAKEKALAEEGKAFAEGIALLVDSGSQLVDDVGTTFESLTTLLIDTLPSKTK